jgi:V/A-type H+-transporting ATPase subunit D
MQSAKPTRQELLRLKKKRQTAQRGHKLLKDKRDGLIQEFLKVVKEGLRLRKKLNPEIVNSIEHFRFAKAKYSDERMQAIATMSNCDIKVDLTHKNIMGVNVSEIDINTDGNPMCYGVLETPRDLDEAIIGLNNIFSDLMKLAELEYTARKLAEEIEKTRRRVNGLEYVVIPDIDRNIRFIFDKLEENSRQEKVTLIKVKELLEKKST